MNIKEKLIDLPEGGLAPGIYSISFSFTLPSDIPSSMYFKDKKVRENPKAKVKYYIKAKLKCEEDDEEMKYK